MPTFPTGPTPDAVVFHGTDMDFDSFDFADCLGPHFGTHQAAVDRLRRTGRLTMPYSIEEGEAGQWFIEAQQFVNTAPLVYGPFNSEAEADRDARALDLKRKPIAYQLEIANPLQLDDLGQWTFNGLLYQLAQMNLLEDAYERDQMWEGWQRGDAHGWALMREALLARGFDSIAYSNGVEDPGSISWIVLDPDKITPAWTLVEQQRPQSVARP